MALYEYTCRGPRAASVASFVSVNIYTFSAFLGSSNLIRDKYRAACLLLCAIPASLFFRCFHFFLCRLAARGIGFHICRLPVSGEKPGGPARGNHCDERQMPRGALIHSRARPPFCRQAVFSQTCCAWCLLFISAACPFPVKSRGGPACGNDCDERQMPRGALHHSRVHPLFCRQAVFLF